MSRSTADIFVAIADPTRRAILDLLSQGEQPFTQIAQPFSMSLPAISQHLKMLSEVGLVTQRKEGRQRFYRLNPEPLKRIADWVNYYEQFWQEKLDVLGKYLEDNP